MILHIDMDAFFASIEQAVNPRLKGKPLIVGSRDNRLHTVVCAASYQAKALGIDSGISSAEAFKICPHLEFVAADQSKYIWTSQQIYRLLKGYGFEVVYASIDEFQMDIGSYRDAQTLARNIRAHIFANFNLTASIGIAKNWLLAKLASKLNKPNGITILSEPDLNQALSRVPVEKLCGVGRSTQDALCALGIKTCLDLYQKPAQFLEKHLGKHGLNFYLSLHSSETFKGNAEDNAQAKSIGHSYTLPRATKNTGFIQAWTRLLSEMVAERLRQNKTVSRTVYLWLNGPEIGNFGAQKTYQEPTNDGLEIYLRSLKIMAKIRPEIAMPKIRALGITCSSLASPDYAPLFDADKRREELLKSMDNINSRFGEGAIYPAVVMLTKTMP